MRVTLLASGRLALLCLGGVAILNIFDYFVTPILSCGISECISWGLLLGALVGLPGLLFLIIEGILAIISAASVRAWVVAASFATLISLALLGALAMNTSGFNTLQYQLNDDRLPVGVISWLMVALAALPELVFRPREAPRSPTRSATSGRLALTSLLLAGVALAVFTWQTEVPETQVSVALLVGSLGAFLLAWFVGWFALLSGLIALARHA